MSSTAVSSRPRLSRGLAMDAHWRWAACRASSSLGSGVMAAKSC